MKVVISHPNFMPRWWNCPPDWSHSNRPVRRNP